MLPLLFVVPTVMLLILVNAATMEMRDRKVLICDNDLSPTSRRICGAISASTFFDAGRVAFSAHEAIASIEKGESDVALIIHKGLENDLMSQQPAAVQLIVNAVNSQQAQLSYAYMTQLINRAVGDILLENAAPAPQESIRTSVSFWYNPTLNYRFFMLPGILTILITVIGTVLSAMNVVREKETGTIEQINVTPVGKFAFIASKLLPFWLIGLVELALGLALGRLFYNVPMEGSITLIFGMSATYLTGLLGLGLFVSTFAQTMQQATFINFFFLLICILMSGIFTSTDNMPAWGKALNTINPVYYFIDIMRCIMLKGATFVDLTPQFRAICIFAAASVSLSVLNYRKRN
jgi:ABC-2 type transport system permease protein